jgi:RNA polymerase primary sigma factor
MKHGCDALGVTMSNSGVDWTHKNAALKSMRESVKGSVGTYDTAIGSYIAQVKRSPRLTHEATVELFKQLEAGDLRAKNKIVESNLRLVISIAKKYHTNSIKETAPQRITLEDLFQEGNCGLIRAIDRFDWKKGFRFGTYATWWIRQAISQFLMNEGRMIRIPAHAVVLRRKMYEQIAEYTKDHDEKPTDDELQELTHASRVVMDAVKQHMNGGTWSLNEPAFKTHTDSHTQGASMIDQVQDHSMYGKPDALVLHHEFVQLAHNVLKELSPKEMAIIRLRFGLVADVPADECRISDEEFEQIKRGAGLT